MVSDRPAVCAIELVDCPGGSQKASVVDTDSVLKLATHCTHLSDDTSLHSVLFGAICIIHILCSSISVHTIRRYKHKLRITITVHIYFRHSDFTVVLSMSINLFVPLIPSHIVVDLSNVF